MKQLRYHVAACGDAKSFNWVEASGNGQKLWLYSCFVLRSIFVSLGRTHNRFHLDLQRHFGSDATPSATENAVKRYLNPNLKRIREAVAAAADVKDLNIAAESTGSGTSFDCALLSFINSTLSSQTLMACMLIFQAEVARIMGTDVTPNGLKFQLTDRIRPIGKRQLDALASGADPKDVDLGGVKGSSGQRRFHFVQHIFFTGIWSRT